MSESRFKKALKHARANLAELLFAALAFLAMDLAGYFLMSDMVKKNIEVKAEDSLLKAEAYFRAGLSEADALLENSVFDITMLIESGATMDELRGRLIWETDWLLRGERLHFKYHGIFGTIDDDFVDTLGYLKNRGYLPQRTKWFDAALRTSGEEIVYTDPYPDPVNGRLITSLVKNFRGSAGKRLGFLVMNMDMELFADYALGLMTDRGVYPMVLNQYLGVVAHPDESFVGKSLREISPDHAKLYDELAAATETRGAVRMESLGGHASVVTHARLHNGWIVILVYPYSGLNADSLRAILVLSVMTVAFVLVSFFFIFKRSVRFQKVSESNRSKSLFMAKFARIVTSPLRSVVGLAELIRGIYGKEKGLEYIFGVKREAMNLLNSIGDENVYLEMRQGDFRLNPAPYLTRDLINGILNSVKPKAREKDLDFETHVSPDMPMELMGDVGSVRKIAEALLNNAVAKTDDGSIELSVSSSNKDGSDAWLSFTVSDTGRGIAEEERKGLFVPLANIDENSDRDAVLNGLGLTLAKRLALLMGGDVTWSAEPKKGSVFAATIVQGVVDSSPMGIPDGSSLYRLDALDTAFHAYDATVLVCDDFPSNIIYLEGLLEPYGINAVPAMNGKEAVRLLKTRSFDLMFLDLIMPVMDGHLTAAAVRALPDPKAKEIPIIALANKSAKDFKEYASREIFQDVLDKPVDHVELDRVLKKWLRPHKG
ncbi:MAG: response regulator [Deltaproteobacteria bacterium]|nr:response regulator [Deltaproteobacteria bacterium]